MKNILGELWHGNISPQEDCRTNTPEMKQLMEYMARLRTPLSEITSTGEIEQRFRSN